MFEMNKKMKQYFRNEILRICNRPFFKKEKDFDSIFRQVYNFHYDEVLGFYQVKSKYD